MIRSWQLQDAKNKLSEVIDRAVREGPEWVTRRGVGTAVVLSKADYDRLTRPNTDLASFFRNSPLVGIELDWSRPTEGPREVDI